MTTNSEFKMRPYTVRELAMMYSPKKTKPDSAVKRLNRWMKTNGVVLERLKEAGYRKYAKYLTPRQVAIIVDTFGEP